MAGHLSLFLNNYLRPFIQQIGPYKKLVYLMYCGALIRSNGFLILVLGMVVGNVYPISKSIGYITSA
jgi:hypothetical protein